MSCGCYWVLGFCRCQFGFSCVWAVEEGIKEFFTKRRIHLPLFVELFRNDQNGGELGVEIRNI